MTERSSGVRVGTWNTELAKPGSAKGKRVRPILAAPDCDILCVTEGYAKIFPDGGNPVAGGDDPGYPIVEGQKNVLLWSKEPWENVCRVGPPQMPEGAFLAGTTKTPIGELTICGVCIPWFDAHVRTGWRDRKKWEEHKDWLEGFKDLSYATGSRTIVLGDFNQRIPRTVFEPHRVHAALLRAFEGLQVATSGFFPWENQDDRAAGEPRADFWHAPLGEGPKTRDQLIDHIAHSPDLAVAEPLEPIGIFPKRTPDKPLSDHIGVWMELRLAAKA